MRVEGVSGTRCLALVILLDIPILILLLNTLIHNILEKKTNIFWDDLTDATAKTNTLRIHYAHQGSWNTGENRAHNLQRTWKLKKSWKCEGSVNRCNHAICNVIGDFDQADKLD